ncbi:hypothetical protein AEQ67_26650 [Pseudomonas sp. RIT-PI-q]|uniref:hypothetical protein n=1 Tax=Pseudomonas sp. RIT-PI-q TaxID=1690247 RepID=UPI0006CE170C|nr:hypothetical protein [Pseudomonas sp. RIT-PI-q]KPG92938.1 hypothetical protein AEQ67_26650 [Pseudomonas sp. RIT-PI-q]
MELLSYISVCKNNGLIIFDALPAGELQTGRRLYSNVTDHTSAIGRNGYCTRYRVSSAASLHAYFMSVLMECRSGVLKPILHFESHGHPEKGLYIADSDEYVAWAQLQEWITQINQATRNHTGVVVAACHGFGLSNGLQVSSPSPFNFLVAPNVEMSAGIFEDTMSKFYKVVAATGDLATGLSSLPEDMRLIVAGEWFYSHLSRYLIHHHTQKDRQEMLEQSVSNQMEKEPDLNRAQRRLRVKQVRKHTKKRLNDPNAIARNFAKIFFHGDPPIESQNFQDYVKANKELRR